jgi:monoamine oxidase
MYDNDHDVLVVGGGLAGLIAARELRHAGHRVLLLEGRDRLGGRAFTSEFAGTDVELGGMSVHWFQPHIWAELTRYGLTYDIPAEPTRWSYLSRGEMRHSTVEELAPRMTELFQRVFPDSLETLPVPHQPLLVADAVAAIDHLSMQDRIDQTDLTTEERDLLNGVLATACSAPCSDGALTAMLRWFSLPGRDFGLMLEAVGMFNIRTRDLVDAILADARPDVRLATPVARIEQRDDRVAATTRDGETHSAPAAVVAVPLNTLTAIDFSPALDAIKQAEAKRGQASRGIKLWAHVCGELEPFFVQAPDDHPITFLETSEVREDGSQLLCAFGPDAELLVPGDEAAVRCAFAELLPDGVEVVEVTGHDWWTDEFSRGTWSVYRPGQLSGALAALQAPHGRVEFAGGDFADGWNGFMDGAIESGLRAARSVTQLLNTHVRSLAAV